MLAAKELQITLTARNKEKGIAIPMCGVPFHAAEGYIGKLIRKGYKVAVCDQTEDPRFAKKLVRREVTRVVTPGTAADSSLGSEENNFLAAVVSLPGQSGDDVGVRAFAALDLSTGEFRATEFSGEGAEQRIQDELLQLRPKELLYGSSAPLFDRAERVSGAAASAAGSTTKTGSPWALTPLDDWIFSPDHAIPILENHFGVLSLEGFGLAGKPAAAAAAGAILYYVRSTQRGKLDHVDRIGFYERHNCLVLDAVTVRNLELIEPLFAGSDAGVTLFRAIDATLTPMGKRLLRAWMLRPALDAAEINQRLDAVEEQVAADDCARRIAARARRGAGPRTPAEPGDAGDRQPSRSAGAGGFAGQDSGSPCRAWRSWLRARLQALHANIDELDDLRLRIEQTIVPEPPISLSEGGVIQPRPTPSLNELRQLSRNGKEFLVQMEQRERERTGISSLKVRFNSVFGYYLEISKANQHLAPADYERQQTLVNAERFTTPELKEYEAKILDAQEKIVEIERRIFAELAAAIAGEARRIRQTALALAEVDVLASFAHLAAFATIAGRSSTSLPISKLSAGGIR